jgi:flagellar biosynthesis protein FlhA
LNANTLGLDPDRAERFIAHADEQAKRLISQGRDPVLLTSPVLRATLFDFLNPMLTDINVLSYNDLVPEADIEVVGQIQLN